MGVVTMLNKIVSLCVVTMLSAGAFAGQQANVEQTVKPQPAVKKVAPKYPEMAHRKGVSGYVLVEYKLDEKGRAQDIEVVEAQPKRVFSKAAIRALKRSRFDVVDVDTNELPMQTKLYVFDIDMAGGEVAGR